MNVAVVTSLYPAPAYPGEGIFAERRWTAFAALGHGVRVVRPVPLVPPGLVRGERGRFREMPRREARAGLSVERPRYPHVPGAPLLVARAFAGAARRVVLAGEEAGARADVIVADYAWPAAACVGWAHAHGRAFVVSGRGSDVLEVRGAARLVPHLADALARADGRVAVSGELAGAMDELAGDRRTRLVPNGVDQDLFRPRERAAARQELGLSPGALVLVVGHLIERKDPLLALEVFAAGAPKDARLAFIGQGALASELRKRADALGVAERLLWRESASAAALASWYAAADVLLLTSKREGRPNVVLEALASGRPVLATRAGGTEELLATLPECLAEDRDPAALAHRLGALLATPPAPERCRAAVAPYTWDATARGLEAALDEALAAHRSRTER